ncbi:MAG: SPOR domain-containing protein [Cyclobacteriaceae bacterium]
MAKKENDSEFEDLNDGGSINEADDNFGLPDIEYAPIDRSEDTSSKETPKEEDTVDSPQTGESIESTESTEEQPYMYAQRPEEEETSSGSDFSVDDTTESNEDSSQNIFGSAEETSEEPEVTDTSEEVSQEEEYVPGSYTPKESSGVNVGAIIGVIIVILLAGLGIWYFMFERPRQSEIAAQEQRDRQEAEAQEAREREAAAAEAERLREEEAAREAEAAALAEEENDEPGTIETISERTGRYYIIVTSSIDGDLAMDYAKDLAADGNSVKIIAPYGNVKFHRVAVANVESLGEAETRMNELKAEYGDGVWVMRY